VPRSTAPRWIASLLMSAVDWLIESSSIAWIDFHAACVTVRYPTTNAYFAYHLKIDGDEAAIEYSGSSAPASIRVLLPRGRSLDRNP
jgi:hypothetical protein